MLRLLTLAIPYFSKKSLPGFASLKKTFDADLSKDETAVKICVCGVCVCYSKIENFCFKEVLFLGSSKDIIVNVYIICKTFSILFAFEEGQAKKSTIRMCQGWFFEGWL